MKLRFSIRDMLWLTLVAGLAIGWWVDSRRLINQRNLVLSETIMVNDWANHRERSETELEWLFRSNSNAQTYKERLDAAKKAVEKLLRKLEELDGKAK